MIKDYANKGGLLKRTESPKKRLQRKYAYQPSPILPGYLSGRYTAQQQEKTSLKWLLIGAAIIVLMGVSGVGFWVVRQKYEASQYHAQIQDADGLSSHQGGVGVAKDSNAVVAAEDKKSVEALPDTLPPNPTFDFYTILPKQTVSVPEQVSSVTATKQFMIQVASYQSNEQAKEMLARLKEMGIAAVIDQVGAWYRVDIGPVESVRKADVIRHELQAKGVNGSMIRQVSISNTR